MPNYKVETNLTNDQAAGVYTQISFYLQRHVFEKALNLNGPANITYRIFFNDSSDIYGVGRGGNWTLISIITYAAQQLEYRNLLAFAPDNGDPYPPISGWVPIPTEGRSFVRVYEELPIPKFYVSNIKNNSFDIRELNWDESLEPEGLKIISSSGVFGTEIFHLGFNTALSTYLTYPFFESSSINISRRWVSSSTLSATGPETVFARPPILPSPIQDSSGSVYSFSIPTRAPCVNKSTFQWRKSGNTLWNSIDATSINTVFIYISALLYDTTYEYRLKIEFPIIPEDSSPGESFSDVFTFRTRMAPPPPNPDPDPNPDPEPPDPIIVECYTPPSPEVVSSSTTDIVIKSPSIIPTYWTINLYIKDQYTGLERVLATNVSPNSTFSLNSKGAALLEGRSYRLRWVALTNQTISSPPCQEGGFVEVRLKTCPEPIILEVPFEKVKRKRVTLTIPGKEPQISSFTLESRTLRNRVPVSDWVTVKSGITEQGDVIVDIPLIGLQYQFRLVSVCQ